MEVRVDRSKQKHLQVCSKSAISYLSPEALTDIASIFCTVNHNHIGMFGQSVSSAFDIRPWQPLPFVTIGAGKLFAIARIELAAWHVSM